MRKVTLILIVTTVIICSTTFGQNSAIPQWIIEDWEFRTQEGGIWIADNSQYKSDNEPFDAYGLQWEWGLGKKSISGRLYCISDGKDVRTAWQFTDFWDPEAKMVKVIQLGGDGTVGQGNMWKEKDGSIKTIQKFVSPGGSSTESGHQTIQVNGESHVQSFNIENGAWKPRRSYIWKNIAVSPSVVSTPAEYKKFEFLIGSWQLKIGEDRFVKMSFEWAQNKLMINYKSTNPAKPGEPIANEVEGIIAYHGVKEQLVFMSAYLDSYPTLMNEGHFEFPQEGVFERIFTVNYKEGSTIPWTDGEVAPKGGKPVEFKQIWTKVDDNSFNGEFLWKKNGKWEHPIPQSGARKVSWKRIL